MAQRIWQLGLVLIVLVGMLVGTYRRMHDGGEIVFPASTGDSVIVRTADGTRVLVDCGNDAPALLRTLGEHRPLLARGVTDVLILTSRGSAWHGGCPAIFDHGVGEVWFLPAAATDATDVCDHGLHCRPLAVGAQLIRGDVVFRVVDAHSLRIDWPGGAVWIAQSSTVLGDGGPWPARGIRVVVMPWVVDPQRAALARMHPTHIIYRSGMRSNTPARKSFAERRVGAAQLLHRDTDGTIRISLAVPAQVWREAQE